MKPRGIEPTNADIGRKVVYRWREEEGVITSFNKYVVFVRYGSEARGQATYRRDLEWVE